MHGVTIQPDTFATIGISPTKVDNSDLSISLIGRQSCFEAGDHIDSHLNMNQVLQEFLYICNAFVKPKTHSNYIVG